MPNRLPPLPDPKTVKAALSVEGLFTVNSFRYIRGGMEIFGFVAVDGSPIPTGFFVGKGENNPGWPVVRADVALCWAPLRKADGYRRDLAPAAGRIMEILAGRIPAMDWVTATFDWEPGPPVFHEFVENVLTSVVPDDVVALVEQSDRSEIYVHLHTNCCQECLFCPKTRPVFEPAVQDDDVEFVRTLVERVVKPARRHGIPVTVRMDANDLAAHAHLHEIMTILADETGMPAHLVVPANRLSSRSVAARFAALPGLFKLSTTIFGSSPETHDSVSGRPGSFAETVRALKNISQLPVWFNGHFILTSRAIDDIGHVFDIFGHFGVDAVIRFLIADCSNHSDTLRPIMPRLDHVRRALESAADRFAQKDRNNNVAIKDFPVCAVPPSIRHAWSSDYRRDQLFEYPVPEECRGCVHLDKCPGLPAVYYELYGTVGLVPES